MTALLLRARTSTNRRHKCPTLNSAAHRSRGKFVGREWKFAAPVGAHRHECPTAR